LNLKGDEGFEFTGRFDLPFTPQANGHEVEQWQIKKNLKTMQVTNSLPAAAGRKVILTRDINTEEDYNKVVGLFSQLSGNLCPVKVIADGKNVKDDETGKWTFVPNGFTK